MWISAFKCFFTFHLNIFTRFLIRNLSRNFDNFIHYLFSLKYQFFIIDLSKTWLTEHSREVIKLSKYTSVNFVRENRVGGRVSLCLFKNIINLKGWGFDCDFTFFILNLLVHA